MARAIPSLTNPGQNEVMFNELEEHEKEAVARRMANRGVPDHKALITDGRFWDYADPESLRSLFNRHPELFLTVKSRNDAYGGIDFLSSAVTEQGPPRRAGAV